MDRVNHEQNPGKTEALRSVSGRRRNVRKAYVRLKAGQEINFAETK